MTKEICLETELKVYSKNIDHANRLFDAFSQALIDVGFESSGVLKEYTKQNNLASESHLQGNQIVNIENYKKLQVG